MARKRNTRSDTFKTRVDVGRLRELLTKHAEGEREMTSTQIQAARILLNKVVPDVKAIEHRTDDSGLIVKIQGLKPPII
jgi:hypothetical protein